MVERISVWYMLTSLFIAARYHISRQTHATLRTSALEDEGQNIWHT